MFATRAVLPAVLAVLMLAAPAVGARDQEVQAFRVDALSPDEAQRGRAFAVEFVRQLAMSRDAAVLVPDWFVRDFPSHLVSALGDQTSSIDHRSMAIFELAPALVRSLEPERVVEYYVAHLNFWYLANLRNVSRLSPAQLRGVRTFDGALPISVSQRLSASPLIRPLLGLPLGEVLNGDAGGRKAVVDSTDDLQRGLNALDAASDLLRVDVSRPPAEASANYTLMRRTFDAAASMAAPGSILGRATICEARCAGLPAGTRVIEVSVLPSLHLHLIDANRQLRILFVDLPVI